MVFRVFVADVMFRVSLLVAGFTVGTLNSLSFDGERGRSFVGSLSLVGGIRESMIGSSAGGDDNLGFCCVHLQTHSLEQVAE